MFITVTTPDGDQWAYQEWFIKASTITCVTLVKAVTNAVENGVKIYCENQGWQQSHWVRCMSFEAAQECYEKVKSQLCLQE